MVGFFNVFKPREISSAYVVNKVKKKLGLKCGHMGTLDPLACGVLPVGVGQASRLFEYLLDKQKTYVATFDFAFCTPSFDLETEPVKFADYIPEKEEILRILPKFIGKISQTPPDFSAKMVDGKRSYKLARRGQTVDLPPKTVEIVNIELIDQNSESTFSFKIDCKGGTYIRSLARDFGSEFSCPATMTFLERTASGIFNKQNSVSIDDFLDADDVSKYLIKPDDALSFPKMILSEKEATRILNGLYDDYSRFENGFYRVYCEKEFRGVGVVSDGILKIKTYVRDL